MLYLLVLCSQPSNVNAIQKNYVKTQSDKTKNDALWSLIIMPFVSFFMISEHCNRNDHVSETGTQEYPFVDHQVISPYLLFNCAISVSHKKEQDAD